MATTKLNFAASVEKWANGVENKIEQVFHSSAEKLAETVVGITPVLTGFLKSSFEASASQMPTLTARPNAEVTLSKIRARGNPHRGALQAYTFEGALVNPEIIAAIRSVKMGGTIYMGYTAYYAGYVEYGANGHPGRGMVRLAAQRWQEFVSQSVAEAKAAVGK